jgi:polysaccharide deacetylase 2 family uncharacterized protein YibQ
MLAYNFRSQLNKKGNSLNTFLILLIILLIVGATIYLGFSNQKSNGSHLLVGEKKSSTTNILREEKVKHESPLGKYIDRALKDIGIPETDVSISRTEHMDHNTPRIVTRRYIDIPSIYPLAHCNLKITQAIREHGGNVLDAVEKIDPKKSVKCVTMQIGEKNLVTQQVILREKPTPREIFTMPRFETAGKIALIIDDFGYSYNTTAQAFMRINRPLTITILPNLPASRKVAEEAPIWGHQVLLHLPMEAEDSRENPGKYGIYANSTAEEIQNRIHNPLTDMPQIIGINNHMGSKVTCNKVIMTAVVRQAKKENVFYIDSMTNSNSVGWKVATELGVPTAKNNAFLDNHINVRAIKRELINVAKIASEEGEAIAIGHPHQSTLKAIQEMIPVLESQGFEFVYVSELVE